MEVISSKNFGILKTENEFVIAIGDSIAGPFYNKDVEKLLEVLDGADPNDVGLFPSRGG